MERYGQGSPYLRIKGILSTPEWKAAWNILMRPDLESHIYIPGVGYVNGLQSGNFVENTGNTAGAVDTEVGLVLDAAGSVGAELCPPLALGNGWNTGTQTTLSSGSVSVANSASNQPFIYKGILTVGKTYEITYTVDSITGSVYSFVGSGAIGVVRTAPGTYTERVQCQGNTNGGLACVAGTTLAVSKISYKEVTGTHATQTTTANKPILRRGIVNLLTWSNDLTNAAWSRAGTPVVTGGQADHLGWTTAFQFSRTTTGASYLAQTYTKSASALQYTLAVVMKAGTSRYSSLRAQGSYPSRVDAIFDMQTGVVNSVSTAGSFSGSAASITSIGNGYYLCTVSATTDANGGLSVHTSFNSTAMPIDGSDVVSSGTGYYSGFGLFQGTLTAQQILAAGGIPLTTTAPASSSAGAYAWQFDGSNDALALPGPLFQMADDHCVVAAARCDSNASNYPFVFAPAYDTNANGAGVAMYIDQSGFIAGRWRNSAGNSDVFQIAGQGRYMRGVPFVGSLRRVGNIVGASFNGTLGFSGAAPTGNSAANTARIGVGDNYLQGEVYAAIAIKGTVSDAELRVLEVAVASTAGVTIS